MTAGVHPIGMVLRHILETKEIIRISISNIGILAAEGMRQVPLGFDIAKIVFRLQGVNHQILVKLVAEYRIIKFRCIKVKLIDVACIITDVMGVRIL